jgi:pimeloyl-ACP methyl ester carboxylesterase
MPAPVLAGVAGLLVCAVAAVAAARAHAQRRAARALALGGSDVIVDEGFVELGGLAQWISIRGESRANPVLLIVHGGPGAPASIFTPRLRAWERHFTVVQWDQRGAGKTFGRHRRGGDAGPAGFAQLSADGIALAERLCARLGQPRIILVAASAGSIVGLEMARQRPDLFHALVATDLNVDTARAEAAGWETTLARLQAAGRRRGVAALAAIGGDAARWDFAAWSCKQRWLMKSDPAARRLLGGLLLPSLWRSPAHGWRDLADLAAGMQRSQAQLFAPLMAHDARRAGTRFAVPFFLFQGDQDLFTPTRLAEEYFAEVEAPHKESAPIVGAGHFAAFVEPEQFLRQLVTRVRPWAAMAAPPRRQWHLWVAGRRL